ncbi:MAG: type II toxin-antitoxin system Phd/YefM family antitoxin [Firmicutes bacterium]|nr:type II toxin-antitoxin system Phd/YefM family antitoxin [Bacillota bacterium]
MEEVGIRKVKNELSRYLNRVKAGEIFIITDRGVPVARLEPVDQKTPVGLGELMQSGEAVWRGGKPGSTPAVSLKKKTGKSLGEMVAEHRR